jgi:oligoendopeptidase F
LRDAGVDMATPAPIEATLRLFDRRLSELETLL